MIIGVLGFAGSGKGTVSDILIRDHGFTRLSFADPVKDATSAVFGWPRYLLEGDTKESREFRETRDEFWSARLGCDVTPRWAMQRMGTEAGRNVFHNELWIHALEKRIQDATNVVIPDVRFPNEMDFIRDQKGFLVRVERRDNPDWYDTALRANRENKPELMEPYGIHYSEWAWIGQPYSYTLYNESTIPMLEADVKHLLRIFTGPAIMSA